MTTLPATGFAGIDDLAAWPGDRARILVVDDEPLVRALMLTALDQEGFATEAACDAREAIDLIGERTFDLVLLDLCMPGPIDGEGLLYTLRDNGEDLPIIIISGKVEIEDRTPECVHAVLKKPIRMEALLEEVRMALQPA